MIMSGEHTLSSNQSDVRFLLITANTGSIFEKPDLLTTWLTEFGNLLRQHPSDFIALHCQEVGGKDYEKFMHTLDQFLNDLLQLPEISSDFTRYRLYFDSDYTSQDTFTALGSAYFIRQNLSVQQWNFTTSSFQAVVNRQIFAGSLVNAQTLRREKYPRDFFPETKWSRKGFTQTRWLINGFTFDLVNVHLFHDASNLLAIERSPSIYSKFRRSALQYTLQRLSLNPSDKNVPYVMFGDFNFRLDACRLVEYISEKRHDLIDKIKEENSDEITKMIIKHENNKPKLTIQKKEFNLHDNHDSFFHINTQLARKFDFESSSFHDHIFEYERTFPPSYPYSEEQHEARSYLRARCPAWCDRILLSHSLKNFVDTQANPPIYDIMGYDVCVGDHKPVYLSLTIRLVQDANDHIQRLKNLTLVSNTTSGLHTSDMINDKPQEIQSVSTNHEDFLTKKLPLLPTTSRISNIDDHRTVLAHHIFHANIKHTLIRFLRETPV
ncbi:unnamed protein product [Rotaria sordida]|uniref:inositol-polyphosphate 5-phosphatase n=2 Tax=Rotaria sordida TaxID=392033 RepID=A0A814B987_9BILA|nr:unnamed protein product [Rotaria sordida]CAF0943885.1 unnamed protein product [Rotaria sordida]CAF1037213.1 unnamed protein product [Rotaria sordida]CAF1039231.1 unnamed protein product [Rotaria sordida]